MKTVRIHPKYALIDIKGLILIYLLLSIITILFWRTVFPEILQGGTVPDILDLGVFFTIPAVLVVFLGASLLSLFRELITRQLGSRFHIRLLAYFILIVIFASLPAIAISSQTALELARFWKTIDVDAAMKAAQEFALETYSLHVQKMENLLKNQDFDALMAAQGAVDGEASPDLPRKQVPGELASEGIMGIQDFALQEDGTWKTLGFLGEAAQELSVLPAQQQGFIPREIPRDTDIIRYMVYPQKRVARVLSYHLGTGFDQAITIIENEKARFEFINSIQIQIPLLLIFYFVVFFFPIILMTLIIAISFTRRVTQPIVELTEATRRVAEGDFSIHILARRKDELGLLIRSFNTMVRDLKRSQASQVKAEKISLWQRMAEQLAHEIKNPLTPIKLSAERVLRRWRNDPKRVGEILETSMLGILQEVEGLSTLLTEFRTFSRPLEPSRTSSPLRDIVEEILIPYRVSYLGVQFNSTHTAWDIQVTIDRRRLAQVLTNLINNGIDAMDYQGTLEIRTDLVKKWESRYCRLSIMDTGKGITPEEGLQIFTPYFTTKATGTGLGLPIVERIVHDHGGSIWFNSAVGRGTTFFVDLPVAETQAETLPNKEQGAS
ncbi:MAG: HAMP domain-containing protein [Treponema sp.]|jgi:nitrogen fixation/metabolism regulation signal transduction histidine kinase|nr:HAMP domain-containing protein [Treponema sp.]